MLLLLGIVILIVGFMLFKKMKAKKQLDEFVANENNQIPTFKEIQSGYSHKYTDSHNFQPVLQVKEFDPYGNGSKAIFMTGSSGQPNAVLVYENGQMKDIATEIGLQGDIADAAYGFAVGDIDGDGVDEVLIAQDSGIYVYKRDAAGKIYSGEKLTIELPVDATPADIQLSDVEKRGHLDLFVSTFITRTKHETANYNNPDKRVSNAFFRNNGDGTFTDASEKSGLNLHHNTFLGRFVDLNGNGYDDLVIAPNTSTGYVYENLKNGSFKKHKLPIGWGFWMGLAVTDLNKNGLPDLYLANTGKAVPAFMMKKDLKPDQPMDLAYKMLRNDGDFKFTDVTKELKLDNPKFGWGMVAADFNGNGKDEIVVTENFYGFPMKMHKFFPSKGSMYVQGQDGKFQKTTGISGVSNPYFGYRAIAIDINDNGFKDLVIANIDGPLRIFINEGK